MLKILIAAVLAILIGIGVSTNGTPVVALVAGIILVVVGVRKPSYAVYLFLLLSLLFGRTLNTGRFILGLDDIGSLLLLTVWFFRRLTTRESFQLPLGFGWLVLYVVLAYFSLINGINPDGAQGRFLRFLTRAFALFAMVDIIRDRDTIIRCFYCLSLTGVFHAIMAFSLSRGVGERLGGLIDQPNLLGYVLVLGLIPLVGVAQIQQRVSMKSILLSVVAIIAVAVILTGSRGIYIAVLPALLWYARRRPARVFLILAVGSISFIGAKEYSQQQIQSIERRLRFQDESVDKRSKILEVAKRLTLEYPLLGVGYGQMGQAYKAVHVDDDHGRAAHSFLVTVVATVGIPALFAMLFFHWRQFQGILSTQRSFSDASSIDKTNLWLAELTITLFIFQFLSLLTRSTDMSDWAIFGLIASIARVLKNKEQQSQKGSGGGTTFPDDGSVTSNRLVSVTGS